MFDSCIWVRLETRVKVLTALSKLTGRGHPALGATSDLDAVELADSRELLELGLSQPTYRLVQPWMLQLPVD